MKVEANKTITLEYTVKDEEQNVVDTNVGGDPLSYVHGQGQIVPGLEEALVGRQVGEDVSVVVAPDKGYGARQDEAMLEVPLEHVPEPARKVGTRLQGKGEDGTPVYPVVSEVRPETIVLDFNHPLAGVTLHFDVKILNVE